MTTQTARVEALKPLPRRTVREQFVHAHTQANYWTGRALKLEARADAAAADFYDVQAAHLASAAESCKRTAATLRDDARYWAVRDGLDRRRDARTMRDMLAEHRAGLIAEAEAGL